MTGPAKKRNRFDRHPKTTLVFLAILVILFLEAAGQMAFFFRHDHTFLFRMKKDSDTVFTPYGLFEYKPEISITMKFKYPAELEVDRYGFIHNGRDEEISGKDFQIFLLGGSTAEGRGASSNSATIAAFLEKILNEKCGRRVRVVNAGVLGYMSYQETARIDGRILREFSPDLIIAFDGRNDAYYMASFGEWKPYWQPYYDRLESDINNWAQPSLAGSLAYWLRTNSSIARMIRAGSIRLRREKKTIVHTRASPVPEETVGQAADSYLSSHVSARAKCRFLGIPYLVFLQPALSESLRPALLPEEERFIEDWRAEYHRPDIYYPALDLFYRKAVEESAARGLDWFYDISRIFAGIPDRVYIDSCHYTDRGNFLIAQKISEVAVPLIGRDPSALPGPGDAPAAEERKSTP